MNTQEMKNTVERIYKIQMAAIRVCEANETYLAAQAAHEAQPYDWTHKDQEGNNRWVALTDDMYRKEGLLKRAVNNFFKVVGKSELAQNWDLGFSAILAYNKFIDENFGWMKTNILPDFSLYSCKALKY